jgi:hypothetical protein
MWCVPTLGARDTERWAERGNKCISALPERRPLSPMNTCGQTATLSSGTFDGEQAARLRIVSHVERHNARSPKA